MDNLSKKLASNDKMLENINNRMDNFSTAIMNQISFNKMIESQLNQTAAAVPTTNPGIPSQPEGLESANLVDMFDAGNNWSNPITELSTDLLPVKRGDPGRPVIPISIGMVDVPEALCDFGSSVNIIPRVLYEKFFTYPLLETTMCLQFADQTITFPKGILKNLCVRVGTVDIWERNKELIRKRTDIGEHFTREIIQSIVFIFLPLGERVHLTNRSITTNPLGNKECLSM